MDAVTMPVTPKDLLRMEQRGLFELVDGVLVDKPKGALSGKTAAIITARIAAFAEQSGLGDVYSQLSIQCFPNKPNQVRRPDISFVTAARLPDVPDEGHVQIRPDLCIEIYWAGDGVYDLDGKLADYRSAGVPLTWVFNPKLRIVRIYKPDRSIIELVETDTLGGEDILPGFSVVVSKLFPAAPAK